MFLTLSWVLTKTEDKILQILASVSFKEKPFNISDVYSPKIYIP